MSGPDKVEAFAIRYLGASRAFLRAPSELELRNLIATYALWHVAAHGGEEGLDAELARIEDNARNILMGRP